MYAGIRIVGIETACIIGVNEAERLATQNIVVNLELDLDLAKAGESDSLEETVDYRAVAKRVIGICEKSTFRLIEALATCIGRTILSEFPKVRRTKVEVWKPGALRHAQNVGVAIEFGSANSFQHR